MLLKLWINHLDKPSWKNTVELTVWNNPSQSRLKPLFSCAPMLVLRRLPPSRCSPRHFWGDNPWPCAPHSLQPKASICLEKKKHFKKPFFPWWLKHDMPKYDLPKELLYISIWILNKPHLHQSHSMNISFIFQKAYVFSDFFFLRSTYEILKWQNDRIFRFWLIWLQQSFLIWYQN